MIIKLCVIPNSDINYCNGTGGCYAGHTFGKSNVCGRVFLVHAAFFDNTKGVIRTTVGYTGGHVANPSYEDVSSGETGHAESIEIEFDPKVVSYEKLLDLYWHNIDPTQVNGQFVG